MFLKLFLIFFQAQGIFAKAPVSAQPSAFPAHVAAKIKASRPDVYQALSEKNEKHLRTIELEQNFVRERLKKFFPRKEAFEPVVLYRGIDREDLVYNFAGEKNLIWTSDNRHYALEYAWQGLLNRAEQVIVLKIVVPKFLVYERSGWPVLRREDVPDLFIFADKITFLKRNKKLLEVLQDHAGEPEIILNYLQRSNPGLFNDNSPAWVKPAISQ